MGGHKEMESVAYPPHRRPSGAVGLLLTHWVIRRQALDLPYDAGMEPLGFPRVDSFQHEVIRWNLQNISRGLKNVRANPN